MALAARLPNLSTAASSPNADSSERDDGGVLGHLHTPIVVSGDPPTDRLEPRPEQPLLVQAVLRLQE